jgi:hypothetical protein
MTRSGRMLGAALLACLVGVAFAGWSYWRYASTYLRDPPTKMPACALAVGRLLRKPATVSGTEPHDDIHGNTVYLTKNEDRAVRCASGIDRDLARRLTTAFGEQEPELRGLELLKILRDIPPGREHDVRAHAAYRMADGAMMALPELPETKAAAEELDLLHACRFSTRMKCPTRPGVPVLVWLVGIPSAMGLLFVISVPARALFTRLVERIKARRNRAPAPAKPPAGKVASTSNGTPATTTKRKRVKSKRDAAATADAAKRDEDG